MNKPYEIIKATEADNALIIDNFYNMWQDLNYAELLIDDWRKVSEDFIIRAIKEKNYAGFLLKTEGKIVASAACQVFAGLYPAVINSKEVKYGYIWGVFVEREYRKRGFAKAITTACTNYLKGIDCSKVILHASPMGRPVYESLGFQAGNEMYLEL